MKTIDGYALMRELCKQDKFGSDFTSGRNGTSGFNINRDRSELTRVGEITDQDRQKINLGIKADNKELNMLIQRTIRNYFIENKNGKNNHKQ